MPKELEMRKKRWRWLVFGLAVLGILVLVVTTVFYVLAKGATADWERLAAELRAAGEPLTYAEIEALHPRLADEKRGASIIGHAFAELRKMEDASKSGILTWDNACVVDFEKGIPRACIEPTQRYVNAHRAILEGLDTLKDLRTVRFGMAHVDIMPDALMEFAERMGDLRQLGRLANLDALLGIIAGDPSAAADAISLQLRVSEALSSEPALLPYLVTLAIDSLAAKTAEGLLRTHELDVEVLERLQREWERQARNRTMKWVWLGERAYFIRMTDEEHVQAIINAARRAASNTGERRWRLPNPLGWIPFKDEWFFQSNRLEGVVLLTRLVQASDDAAKLLATAKQEKAVPPSARSSNELISIMAPSFWRSIEQHARGLAFFRCVPVALAAERYRLATGRFPETIAELVPDYLASVPDDPYDGKPIRMVLRDERLAAYSVGENMTDDGGQVVAAEGERFGLDFGVRLLLPSERRLLILDAPDSDGP